MKKTIGFLIILIFVLSCEKEEPTTYVFKNETKLKLHDFSTFYWDGDVRIEEKYHGDLSPGKETNPITTTNPQIDFSFSYDPDGIEYVSANTNRIIENKNNVFSIDYNTRVFGGTTYFVVNNSSYPVYNFSSMFYNGNDVEDLIDHGTLMPGDRTEHVKTTRNEIYIGFTDGPDLYNSRAYIGVNPYPIYPNIMNELIFDDETIVFHGEEIANFNKRDEEIRIKDIQQR